MIKEVLDKLEDVDRRKIMYAFDHELSQVVRLPNRKFLAVNIVANRSLRILEQVGVWAYGEEV